MSLDVVTLGKVKKLSNPGAENVGRFLGVNSNGETVPMSIGAGQTTIDPSLATAGAAADAKAAGDAIRANSAAIGELKEDIADLLTPGKNLINPNKLTEGMYLKPAGTTDDPESGFTDYIKVEPFAIYSYTRNSYFGSVNGVYYDVNKNPISVVTATDATQDGVRKHHYWVSVPDGVAYVRMNFRVSDKPMLMFTMGERLDFEPYQIVLNPSIAVPQADAVREYINQIDYLHGKKICWCGDSITYGASADVDENGLRKTYGYYISKRHEMDYNVNAISGSTMTDVEGRHGFSVPGRYDALPDDLDYIIIAFGTNESKANVGNPDDTTNKTLYGAFNIVLPYLIDKYPTAKIGLVKHWQVLSTVKTAIECVAKKYHLPLLDFDDHNVPLISRNYKDDEDSATVEARAATFTADITHPNDAGYRYISTFADAWLKTL